MQKYPQIKSFSADEYNLSKVLPELIKLFKDNPNITECTFSDSITLQELNKDGNDKEFQKLFEHPCLKV